MPTFFDEHKGSFGACQITAGGLDTVAFLNAAEVLVVLLGNENLIVDSLGAAFSPVKSDISGNISKLRKKFAKNPDAYKTLQMIVIAEKQEKDKEGTDALLWLKRALQFTFLALKNNRASTEELSVSFSQAYKETLSKHHSFMVKPIFSLAMNACPSRVNFYKSLARDGDVATVEKQLDTWLHEMEAKLVVLVDFYKAEKLDS